MSNATGYPSPMVVLQIGKTQMTGTTRVEVQDNKEYQFVASNPFAVALGGVYRSKYITNITSSSL